jgi:hypothetical protein
MKLGMKTWVGLTLGWLAAVVINLPLPASAEVRFGRGVKIGGHDVSNQTFNRQRRGEFNISTTRPPNPGCRWRANRDGSRTKVCNLKRKAR